jgi:flagellar assembly protein FliH
MVEPIVIRLNRRVLSVQASSTMPALPAKPIDGGTAKRIGQLEEREAAVEQQRIDLQAERQGLTQAKAAMLAVAQKLEKFQHRLSAEAEENLLELSLQMARKVLMQEIQAGRYEIDPILAEAMAKLPPRQDAVVRLNPSDLAHSQLAQQTPNREEGGTLTFVGDPAIQRAECVLETGDGQVESKTSTHLDEIERALRGQA